MQKALFGRLTLPVAVAAVVIVGSASPAAAADSRVTVVHGLRGLVADVWLDGTKVLERFQPERATDPLNVPAGSHQVDIRAAGAAESAAPLLSADLDVPSDEDLTVIAHLDANGKPTVSVYRDQDGSVPAGRSRVVVRHAAAAPRIGVTLDDKPLLRAVAPGGEGRTDVSPGTHTVAVTAAPAGGTPLLAPEDVPLEEGTGMVLYLIGSQESRTLAWLAQPVRGRATLPSRIATGNSGLRTEAAHRRLAGGPVGPALIVTTGLVLALLARRRSRVT